MSRLDDILVVGGYGVVGSRVAGHLARWFPGRVVIAGRDEHRAAATCRELGHGARPRHIDVGDPPSIGAALDGVGTVMACVAQHAPHLLKSSSARGLAYADIAPGQTFWADAQRLHAEAGRTGARIVFGAGLSPGISNVMARKLKTALGHVERIQTAILLSLGDEYGPDSMDHVLGMMQPFTVFEGGRDRRALPFSEGTRVRFPGALGTRTAYLFPWSDVVHYPRTLGVRTALGRFALDPPWVGRAASVLAGVGAAGWLKRSGSLGDERGPMARLKRRYARRDAFALVVTAEAGGRCLSMSLAGRRQAEVTAAGAAEIARALATGEVAEAGMWLPEQVIPHERFLEGLSALGWRTTLEQETNELSLLRA